jgi:hypothetical protein
LQISIRINKGFAPAIGLNLSSLKANIWFFHAVSSGVMINDLLQIQKDLGAPQREPRRRAASGEELDATEDGYDSRDWLAMPINHSRYHKGYTTNHWLSVFRAVTASG